MLYHISQELELYVNQHIHAYAKHKEAVNGCDMYNHIYIYIHNYYALTSNRIQHIDPRRGNLQQSASIVYCLCLFNSFTGISLYAC